MGGPGISKDDNTNIPYKNKKMMSDTMLETKLCDAVVINESENLLIDILTNNRTGKFSTGTQLTQDELNQLPTPSYIDYKVDLYASNSKIFHLTLYLCFFSTLFPKCLFNIVFKKRKESL